MAEKKGHWTVRSMVGSREESWEFLMVANSEFLKAESLVFLTAASWEYPKASMMVLMKASDMRWR